MLQSSSAIVEIFKSKEKFVEVKYADGQVEKVYDDVETPDIDEAFEHLRKIGALQDRFRSIPTTLIDSYIVEGVLKPGSPIPVEELQRASRLPLAGKEELIQEYLRERSLSDIPVEVRFGFPLKYAFDELRLVDTPGVNAMGGVQDQTLEYLYKANAVLFVLSMEGPIENSSFNDFLTNVLPNRSRDSLFLVLSKSGSRSEIEIEEKLLEAQSIYGANFDTRHILHVDSMLKMIVDEFDKFDSPIDIKLHYSTMKKHFEEQYRAERQLAWRDEAVNFGTKLRLLNNVLDSLDVDADKVTVLHELQRLSNFETMKDVIDHFSVQAAELQLAELLNWTKQGYQTQVEFHEQNVHLLQTKAKNPQTFENEISEIQSHLQEYRREMNMFSERIRQNYTGVESSSRRVVSQVTARYKQRLERVGSEQEAKKLIADFNDECEWLVSQEANRIAGVFSAKVSSLGGEFKTKHQITIPKVDAASIIQKAKENAYEVKEVVVDRSVGGRASGGLLGGLAGGVVGFLFGGPIGAVLGAGVGGGSGTAVGNQFDEDKVERKSYFSSDKFNANFRSLAFAMVQTTESKLPKVLSNFVNQYTKSFRESVSSLIRERDGVLEEMRSKQEANDELIRKIDVEEAKKKFIYEEVSKIDEILEDLR